MARFFTSLVVLVVCPLLLPFLHARGDAASIAAVPPQTDLTQLITPGRHVAGAVIDNLDRKFIVVTPGGIKPGEHLPIVFFFHGAGGNATQASLSYGWTEKAEKEHFIAVFPEGLPAFPEEPANLLTNPRIWRDGRSYRKKSTINDTHFFEELLNRLQAVLPVDTHRIYVTGFSNGAGMSFNLGSRFSDRLAAIAPVSSESFTTVPDLARPLPVYYLVGTADPLVPYHGGKVTLPWGVTREMPPVQDSVEAWVKLDGAPVQPQVLEDSNGVRVLRYGHGNSEVLFTVVEGNGHHWPGTREPLPRVISGPSVDPFHATDRIWDFFQAHPLP